MRRLSLIYIEGSKPGFDYVICTAVAFQPNVRTCFTLVTRIYMILKKISYLRIKIIKRSLEEKWVVTDLVGDIPVCHPSISVPLRAVRSFLILSQPYDISLTTISVIFIFTNLQHSGQVIW